MVALFPVQADHRRPDDRLCQLTWSDQSQQFRRHAAGQSQRDPRLDPGAVDGHGYCSLHRADTPTREQGANGRRRTQPVHKSTADEPELQGALVHDARSVGPIHRVQELDDLRLDHQRVQPLGAIRPAGRIWVLQLQHKLRAIRRHGHAIQPRRQVRLGCAAAEGRGSGARAGPGRATRSGACPSPSAASAGAEAGAASAKDYARFEGAVRLRQS